MRRLIIIILISLATGCEEKSAEYDSRLEGKWFSNKEMSLRAIDKTKLSGEKVRFLEKNLGDLGYIYKKDKIAALFKSDPDFAVEFNKYKLIATTEKTVTISSLGGPEVIFTFVGNCYFLEPEKGYKEYFCKEK